MSATPCRDDVAAVASLTKAAAPKKSTVDYIPSKLSYDTVIPVYILADRSDFIEKCKPYDIIDGPNPLNEPDAVDAAASRGQAVLVLPAPQVIKSERASGLSTRRSSRAALKAEKAYSVKRENGDEGQDVTGVLFARPSRSGWSKERLQAGRPYQLVRSDDMETHVRYVLDDVDYDWCECQHVAPENLQRGMTYLEWAYASSLLKAAMPHTANPPDKSAAPCACAFTTPAEGFHSSSIFTMWHEGATTIGNKKRAASSQQNGKAKTLDEDAAVCLCALCSKPVHLLASQLRSSAVGASAGGATSIREGRARATRSAGASSSLTRASGGATLGGVRSRRVSALNPSLLGRSTKRSFTNGFAEASLPLDGLHSEGLRCSDCGVVAHLRCWFFSELPKLPEAWTCDGCTIYARHRKRSARLCCMCGRAGGVLLPYVSFPLRDDGAAADPQFSPTSTSAGLSASMGALSDVVCHAVCALSMPELTVHHQNTVLRRNGLIDMQARPYVYARRRVGKDKYGMNCEFCQRGSGRCVQCAHPHCFEAMHASCAAEAHTADFQVESPFFPNAFFPSGASASAPVSGFLSAGNTEPVGPASSVGSYPRSVATWTSCSPYCRKHYGYSVRNSAGSAALAQKAEAEALALDLTGLLTGSDGATSPMVRKRGRGRPPTALVRQRELERDLISKLRAYWLERREQRRQSSAQLASEINARLRPVVEASLRPEIVKISAEKVRLSHFLSLVPEWQGQLVAIVEGELPVPDEEYDDVQTYRKVAHTRRSGNTRSLYGKMCECAVQLDLVCQVAEAMKEQCRLRRSVIEQELAALRILSGWR
ncbi:hypothetical protein LSCM1_00490 [Leishmania martiniquensis]|uniref:PHD-type domain-containing protein n=1 Tax=Leishmania martiniquensis TaxID=1580590 RepID=A0A836GUE2_9TRYP|nr:hypothetical protein LSCM1_00490 [Leishmania martiniquensis]